MLKTSGNVRRAVRVGVAVASVAALLVAGSSGSAGAVSDRARASAAPPLTAKEIQHYLQPRPGLHGSPPVAIARQIAASRGAHALGNMTYHGGAVMRTANNSVPIFWLPTTVQDGSSATVESGYAALIQRYFQDVGGSGLYQVNTQYYQTINGPQEFIMNSSGFLQAIVDTSPYPAAGPGCAGVGVDCLDDAQLTAKISAVLAAHPSLPQDLSTEYFVFTAPHESSCDGPTFCFKSDTADATNFAFCAYHSSFFNGANRIVYANMPYDAVVTPGVGCTTLSSFPNAQDGDIELSTTSHEQMESTTDPSSPAAWYFLDNGGEIGDLCAYNYGALNLDGGLANEQWNGHFYALQQEWSNADSGCSQGTGTSGPPNDSFANRQVILPPGGTTNGSNVGATKEGGEPNHAGNSGGASVWYVWVPGVSGTVTVDTCTSSFDTTLGVYTGTAVSALTTVASNDDSNNCAAASQQSSLTFFANYGSQYRIAVDGFDSGSGAATGSIVLHTTGPGGAAPGKPTIDGVTSGDGWINVAFSPPSSSGGSPIGGYSVVTSTGSFVTVPAGDRRAVLATANGVSTTATVQAVNLGGPGPSSTASAATTPTAGSVNITTAYNASDNTRLLKNATYFASTSQDAQRISVGVIAFIAGLVGSPVLTPIAPPVTAGPNSYTTPWSTVDQGALVTVMRQYGVTPSEAQYFCVQLVGFLLAFGGH